MKEFRNFNIYREFHSAISLEGKKIDEIFKITVICGIGFLHF